MRQILLFIFLLPLYFSLSAQTTVFFQGFENAALTCTENWGYTGGARNNQTARTGTFSGMVGRSGGSAMMTFNDVNVSSMAGLNLQIFHSVRGGAGPGMDVREGALIRVSINGAAFTTIARIGGSNDHSYGWAATGGLNPIACAAPNNVAYQTPNPLNYAIPAGTNTISVQIISIRVTTGANAAAQCTNFVNMMNSATPTASSYDRTDEGFHVDDVRITTTSTFFTNVWLGTTSQDWNVCSNWSLGIVPTAAHNVLINQSGTVGNNCRLSTAPNGVCNNLTLTSTNNNTQDLEVRGRTLNIVGDAVVFRAGTGNVGTVNLKFEAQDNGIINVAGNLTATMNAGITSAAELEVQAETGGQINVTGNCILQNNATSISPFVWLSLGNNGGVGVFNCTNLTLTGNSSTNVNNTRVEFVNNAAHVFEVRGNYLMQNNARFNVVGQALPIIRFGGHFTNQVSEAQFLETNSTIRFNGNGLQQISTAGFTEIFHNINLEKPSGIVQLLNNIQLSATGVLSLGANQLNINGRQLSVTNSATGAITRTTGSIIEESGAVAGVNSGKINWTIDNIGGAHVYPFARGVGGPYIPLTFERTAGNAGVVSVSTYGTGADNLPWPSGPVDLVNNLNSPLGLSPDNRDATVDRFWQIDVTGTPTASMTFSYASSELSAAPYNDPFSLVAQRYEATSDTWQIPVAVQTASMFSVTVNDVTTFSPWTLTNSTSLLPVELLSFEAMKEGALVRLDWKTATQLNNDYFDVQRSADGFIFETIGIVEGAGNYDGQLSYEFYDKNPLKGVNYYRIKIVDFDNATDYSKIIALIFNRESDINVFPNPVSKGQMLNIVSEEPISAVKIYNSLGQMLIYENNVESQIRFPSDISAGIYTMMIELNGNTLYRKLVID